MLAYPKRSLELRDTHGRYLTGSSKSQLGDYQTTSPFPRPNSRQASRDPSADMYTSTGSGAGLAKDDWKNPGTSHDVSLDLASEPDVMIRSQGVFVG